MRMQHGVLWTVWLLFVALFAAGVVAPFLLGPPSTPYGDAGIEVLSFVLALLATTAGVGSLASRESLTRAIWAGRIDPTSGRGLARMLRSLVGAWALCLLVAGMGLLMAFASARPASQWPYALAGAALLLFHAPRAHRFHRGDSP